MANRLSPVWSDEEKQILRNMLEAGASYQEIAVHLPRRRIKSIKGKAGDLQLVSRGKRGSSDTSWLIKIEQPPKLIPKLKETTNGISFFDCKNNMCRWIIGHMRCCGKPIIITQPKRKRYYCEKHYRDSIK